MEERESSKRRKQASKKMKENDKQGKQGEGWINDFNRKICR